MTRALHAAGGFHNDLYWRNILVQNPQSDAPVLLWIDCPRGGRARFGFLGNHRRIKDLAALYLDSVGLCSVKDRVSFLRWYLGVKKLGNLGKGLLRNVEAYRRRRWPADYQA